MSDKLEALKAAALAATPQDIDTAQTVDSDGYMECPHCEGHGHVDMGNDYCNYDGKALGVIFYGIGDAHVKAQAYFREAKPAVVLELLAALEEKDQSIAELNVKLFDQSILLDAAISRAEASEKEVKQWHDVAIAAAQDDADWHKLTDRKNDLICKLVDAGIAQITRANAAEQREGHLKASVDVLSAKNAELQQRLQQPIKLPDIRSEDYHESGWFQHMKYYRAVVRSIQALELKVEGE